MYYDENINITKDGDKLLSLQMKDEDELYGTVNVTVADGADIYFDGKKVGIGSWYQRLKAGTYVVETRKQNCESQTTSFEVEGKSDKTVEVKAPIPYTGSLTVLTTPKQVGMYSDTKLLSENGFAKLPIGKNEITYKHEVTEASPALMIFLATASSTIPSSSSRSPTSRRAASMLALPSPTEEAPWV